MTEQIRKYLTIGNVIVLLSLKLSQLTLLKKQQFIEEYNNANKKGMVSLSTIEDMAENYMTKFLPYHHRIYMPNGDVYGNMDMAFMDNPDEKDMVSLFIPKLIFQKTRYLFYNSSVQTNYIVPTNLRELCQLALLLHGMQSYNNNDDGNNENNEYNKIQFRKYFTETWLQNHLSNTLASKLTTILQVNDNIQFNAIVLKAVKDCFGDNSDYFRNNKIFDTGNKKYNISMGDVMGAINKIKTGTTKREELFAIFFIETIYSMRLYETYDMMTESNRQDEENGQASLILNQDPLGGKSLSEYHRLVGGNFLSSDNWEILPATIGQKPRNVRKIAIDKLNDLIAECLNDWDNIESWKIRLAELFMLCTARPYIDLNKKKPEDFNETGFRKMPELWYTREMSMPSSRNGTFDINTFMFNITRIESCYSRFKDGDKFYKKANKDNKKKSLLSCFKYITMHRHEENFTVNDDAVKPLEGDDCIPNYPVAIRQKWLSFACIRNVDVLLDLIGSLKVKGETRDANVLAKMFGQLASYKIKTYDKDKMNTACDISFVFAYCISNLLKIEEIDKYFDAIYNPLVAKTEEKKHFVYLDAKKAKGGMSRNANIKNNRETYRQKILDKYREHWDEEIISIFNSVFNDLPKKITREDVDRAVETFNNQARALKEDIPNGDAHEEEDPVEEAIAEIVNEGNENEGNQEGNL